MNSLLETWQAKIAAPFAVIDVRTIGERLVRIEYLPRGAALLKPQLPFATEVCRQLKASAATFSIPVIFVTAHNDTANEAAGLEFGAVDCPSRSTRLSCVPA